MRCNLQLSEKRYLVKFSRFTSWFAARKACEIPENSARWRGKWKALKLGGTYVAAEMALSVFKNLTIVHISLFNFGVESLNYDITSVK